MALRALKTEDEIAAVPLDRPVLVELPREMTGTEDDDVTALAPAEPERKERQAKPKKDEADEAATVLAKQLEELKASHARELLEREKHQQKLEAELRETRTQHLSSEEAAIQGSLTAAQEALASAKAEMKRAGQDADYDAMAEAQVKIGRLTADIRSFEVAAAELAHRKESEAKAPQQDRGTPSTPVDPLAAVRADPNLMPAEKDWIIRHQDALYRGKELEVAHTRAMGKGLIRGSDEYFAHLDDFMGYAAPSHSNDTTEREVSVQAPVSRQERDGGGRPSATRITLSPEQRDIARSLGISETEYAKQLHQFDLARKADPDKYR